MGGVVPRRVGGAGARRGTAFTLDGGPSLGAISVMPPGVDGPRALDWVARCCRGARPPAPRVHGSPHAGAARRAPPARARGVRPRARRPPSQKGHGPAARSSARPSLMAARGRPALPRDQQPRQPGLLPAFGLRVARRSTSTAHRRLDAPDRRPAADAVTVTPPTGRGRRARARRARRSLLQSTPTEPPPAVSRRCGGRAAVAPLDVVEQGRAVERGRRSRRSATESPSLTSTASSPTGSANPHSHRNSRSKPRAPFHHVGSGPHRARGVGLQSELSAVVGDVPDEVVEERHVPPLRGALAGWRRARGRGSFARRRRRQFGSPTRHTTPAEPSVHTPSRAYTVAAVIQSQRR